MGNLKQKIMKKIITLIVVFCVAYSGVSAQIIETLSFGSFTYNLYYSGSIGTSIGATDPCANVYRDMGIAITGGTYGGSFRYNYLFKVGNYWYSGINYIYTTFPSSTPIVPNSRCMVATTDISPQCTELWSGSWTASSPSTYTRTFTGSCGLAASTSTTDIRPNYIDIASRTEIEISTFFAHKDGRMVYNSCTDAIQYSSNNVWRTVYAGVGPLTVGGSINSTGLIVNGPTQFNGSVRHKLVKITTDYAVLDTDEVIIYEGNGCPIITLPNPSSNNIGRILKIKNNSSQATIASDFSSATFCPMTFNLSIVVQKLPTTLWGMGGFTARPGFGAQTINSLGSLISKEDNYANFGGYNFSNYIEIISDGINWILISN